MKNEMKMKMKMNENRIRSQLQQCAIIRMTLINVLFLFGPSETRLSLLEAFKD